MNRFRELRLQNGYSQKQLKDLYNAKYGRSYSTGAMSLIETGKRMPELGALLDFADFYGVSLDYLLGRDLAEDVSFFTISINMLLDIPWYIFPQKGFPDAV